MLSIYYADIQELPTEIGLLPISDYRREVLDKLRHPMKRRQSLGVELLLMKALREKYPDIHFPIQILKSEEGKPYLPDLPIHFSLSHSGVYSACVLSGAPIGLDIQMNRVFQSSVSKRCFTPEEMDILLKCPSKDYAFSMLWSLKESYLKATGIGLYKSMQSVSVEFDVSSPLAKCEGARFNHTYKEECHFSVCVMGCSEPDPVELKKIKLL